MHAHRRAYVTTDGTGEGNATLSTYVCALVSKSTGPHSRVQAQSAVDVVVAEMGLHILRRAGSTARSADQVDPLGLRLGQQLFGQLLRIHLVSQSHVSVMIDPSRQAVARRVDQDQIYRYSDTPWAFCCVLRPPSC